MSQLLDLAPYGPRDDARFLEEMRELTRAHLNGCPPYAAMWRGRDAEWERAGDAAALPFVHVGLFKHLDLRTEVSGLAHGRTLESSSTTGATPSRIALDAHSSALQARSSRALLADYVGDLRRPLLILDAAASLRRRGGVGARVAAAMSLQPFASETHFLLGDAGDPGSLAWEALARLLEGGDEFLVYGFTWILWQAWAAARRPEAITRALAGKTIHFVHSGGWKKLEALRVDRATLDAALLAGLAPASRVIDYYGLVEQVGVVYPLCEEGLRHVPVWAEVLVRDPYTLASLVDAEGSLQLMNVLAHGAPYHNVLTEDLGRLVPGDCACGRGARRFELLGRIPRAELRGCANV